MFKRGTMALSVAALAVTLGMARAASAQETFIAPLGGFGGLMFPTAVTAQKRVLFRARTNTGSVWATDGTTAGTSEFLNTAQLDGGGGDVFALVSGGTRAVVFVGSGQSAQAVLGADGTSAGTEDLARQGPITGPVAFGASGAMFFRANELWRTDGTAAGTALLKTFHSAGTLRTDGDRALLTAPKSGALVTSLWISDGTGPGTQEIAGTTGTGSVEAFGIAKRPGGGRRIFMSAVNTLFVSDDETTATPVKDLGVGAKIKGIAGVGSSCVFFAFGALWRSDGTAAGTAMVKDLVPNAEDGPAGAVLSIGDRAVFRAANQVLYATDGSAEGTVFLKDGQIFGLRALGDAVYFANTTDNQNVHLWRSDGTQSGTFALPGQNANVLSQAIGNVGNRLFYAGTRTGEGLELFSYQLSDSMQPAADGGTSSGGPGTTPGSSAPDGSVDGAPDSNAASPGSDGGCGCRAAGPHAFTYAGAAFAALAFAIGVRRRNRRR